MIRPWPESKGFRRSRVLERLTASVRAGEVSERATAFYLKEVKDRGLVDLWDPAGSYPFAEARFGYSPKRPGTCWDRRRAPELPKLDRAFNRGRSSGRSAGDHQGRAPVDRGALDRFRPGRTPVARSEQKVAEEEQGRGADEGRAGLPRTAFEFTLKMGAKDHQIIDTASRKYLATQGGRAAPRHLKAWAMRSLITPCGDTTAQHGEGVLPFLVVFHIDPVKGTAWMAARRGG